MNHSTILVTGAAGFIGSSLSEKLVSEGFNVVGIDNFFPSYPRSYKLENIQKLQKNVNFNFYEGDILDIIFLKKLFTTYKPSKIFHLAALAGVRASKKIPDKYITTNIQGTKNLYEFSHAYAVEQFIFASSSSVYGSSLHIPFSEDQKPLPQSVYAKTKLDAEILLKELHTTFMIPTTILRFFSVYGPKGRPDMAPYLFTQAAYRKTPIIQYGNGTTARDYTYISDIVDACFKAAQIPFNWQVMNIGNSSPNTLETLITTIENITKFKIIRNILPINTEEAEITYANITKAKENLKWQPRISLEEGLEQFIFWYKIHRNE